MKYPSPILLSNAPSTGNKVFTVQTRHGKNPLMKSNSQLKKSIRVFFFFFLTNEESSYSETTSKLRPTHMFRVVSQAFSSGNSQI